MNKDQERFLWIAKDTAKVKGGNCLSDEYVDLRSKLDWECQKGHKWSAPFRNIRERDSWCPECRKETRKYELLNTIKPILTRKGWILVEGKIQGWKRRTLTIECDIQHQWVTSPQAIKYNGCPECEKHCYDKEKHMQQIKQIVLAKEGEIISGSYQNLNSVFIVQCKKGHKWKAKAAGLKNDKWCPTCHGRNKKEQLKKVRNNAKKKGGQCLSNDYKGKDDKLEFKCINGHTFRMTPNNVNKGQWCPKCSWYIMEHKTRYALEKLLNCEFNPDGKVISPFVLDGYTRLSCGKKIAFEYHGRQHYEFIEFFHGTKEVFEQRKKDDKKKEELCVKKNIHLIIVPHYSAVTDESLLETIRMELSNIGLPTQNFDNVELFFRDYNKSCPPMERLKKIIKGKGGTLLTHEYNGKSTPITIQCEKGHIWTTEAMNLFTGRWCRFCANQDKEMNFNKLKHVVTNKGGVLLTEEYINNQQKVEIQCKENHFFNMRVHNIVSLGQWCPKCAKVSRDKDWQYDQLKTLVIKKGGILLTPSYTSSKDKVEIQCEKGHTFEIIVNNLKSHNQWCPFCTGLSRDKKWQYKRLEKDVMEKGGTLITTEYTTASTKVEIICTKNHIFRRTPYELRAKNMWCPNCQKIEMKSAINEEVYMGLCKNDHNEIQGLFL